jgi:hypothetical protein
MNRNDAHEKLNLYTKETNDATRLRPHNMGQAMLTTTSRFSHETYRATKMTPVTIFT